MRVGRKSLRRLTGRARLHHRRRLVRFLRPGNRHPEAHPRQSSRPRRTGPATGPAEPDPTFLRGETAHLGALTLSRLAIFGTADLLLLHADKTDGGQSFRFSSVPEMYFGFVFSRALVTDEGCTTPAARLSLEQRGLRRVLKRFDPQTRSPPSRWVFCCTFRAEIHPQFPFSGGRLTENGTAPVQFQSGTESDSRCLLCGSESHSVGQ